MSFPWARPDFPQAGLPVTFSRRLPLLGATVRHGKGLQELRPAVMSGVLAADPGSAPVRQGKMIG